MESATVVDTGQLRRGEYLAMGGGLLLAISVFLPWYGIDGALGEINAFHTVGTYSAWDVHPILRWLLLVAAVAPFVLAWIVARNHKLSWPRGELTMVIALTAGVLIVYQGVIGRPGEPPSLISLQWGWFVALLGAALMFGGSIARQGETGGRIRKPPGVV